LTALAAIRENTLSQVRNVNGEKIMAVLDRKEVLAIVESWPVDDRLSFVQEVWDRIPVREDDSDMTEELKVELDRRVAAFRANPERAIPWEQVYSEAMARIRR
jgi:putative addiction module component (TIGR02574 family)